MAVHPYTRFCDTDRDLQQRLLISVPHSALVARSGLTRQAVNALAVAQWPISLFRAVQFAEIQQDFRLLSFVVEQAGAILLSNKPKILSWGTLQLLSSLAMSFGRFFEIAQKIHNEEPLTDKEMRDMEADGEQMKIMIDSLREKSRQQRRKQQKDKE